MICSSVSSNNSQQSQLHSFPLMWEKERRRWAPSLSRTYLMRRSSSRPWSQSRWQHVLCQMRTTVSVIAPLHEQLLQATQESLRDPLFVRDLKESIHQVLSKRYSSEVEKATLNLASALDPRFKVLPFLPEEEKQETIARMVAEAAATVEHCQLNIYIHVNKALETRSRSLLFTTGVLKYKSWRATKIFFNDSKVHVLRLVRPHAIIW